MNLLNSFIDFYDNLSSDGMFFFWIVIFLFSFLMLLCIILVVKNKKLIRLLNEGNDNKVDQEIVLQNEKNDNEQQENVSQNSEIKKEEEILENNINIFENIEKKEDSVDEIKDINISKEDNANDKIEEVIEKEDKIVNDVVEKKDDVKVNINVYKEEPKLYEKNVLREMSQKMPTSPINIERSKIDENTDIVTVSNDVNYNDFDMKEDNNFSPLEDMEDIYEVNDNMKFANEIVEKMEKEIKPSNIELTDYEKKQEEEAIISYDELLKVKDKIYNITDDEETDEFIDELKNLRLDLE